VGFNAVGTATLLTLVFAASVSLSGCTLIGASLGTPSSADFKGAKTVADSELSGIRRDARVIVRLRSGEAKRGTWIGFSRLMGAGIDSLHATAGSEVWAGGGVPTTVEIPGDSLRAWFAEDRCPSDMYALLQRPERRNRDEVIDRIPLADLQSVDVGPRWFDTRTGFKVGLVIDVAIACAAIIAVSSFGAGLR